jgi:hypothetical protein
MNTKSSAILQFDDHIRGRIGKAGIVLSFLDSTRRHDGLDDGIDEQRDEAGDAIAKSYSGPRYMCVCVSMT